MKRKTRNTAAPYGTWKCVWCDEIFRTRAELIAHKHRNHTRYDENGNKINWNKGQTKETNPAIAKISKTINEGLQSGRIIPAFKGKHHSKEFCQKLSDCRKLEYQQGKRSGWTSRNIESYPEKFWKKVLKNNSIDFEFNFYIKKSDLGCKNEMSGYFLDFKLKNNIDLEIDGRQHHDLDRVESDKKRDKLLKANGWKIYRIEWNEINSDYGKRQMQEKIQQFLKWYNIAKFDVKVTCRFTKADLRVRVP